MSSRKPSRTLGAISAGLAGLMILTSSEAAFAQTSSKAEPPKETETFTGTTVNLTPGAGENVSIHVLRWSTDADRERLAAVFKDKGEAGLPAVFEETPSVGILWTSETLGYSLRFAHRVALPDGGERIVIATGRRLGFWSQGNLWKAAGQPAAPDYPFTVVELRLNRRGLGEGKMSLAAKVTFEPDAKTLALENYASGPILIKDVKRTRSSGPPSN